MPATLRTLLMVLAVTASACASSASPPASAPASALPVASVEAPAASTSPPIAVAAPPPAAPPPVPEAPQGQTVSLGGGGASGWLGAPTGAGKHPAVLVIQEWLGVTDWVKSDVTRFASQGYVALAVDLYRGKVAHDPGEAHELMRGLPEDRALDDMKAGFDWLAARADVDARRIGIVGWCMGGGYALAFGVSEPRLAAIAMNYGKLVTSPEKIKAIHAPLLGNFAGLDRGIAPDEVRAFGDKLKAAGKTADLKIYDGSKHAFMNSDNKEAYDAASANDAWTRIDAFFARTLKPR